MKPARSFASDNNAGVHAEVLEAIAAANRGHAVGYGDDPFTRSAVRRFEQHFGSGISVFPVFNGTAANVLSVAALARSFHAVICGSEAHLYEDECGAPEKFVGCEAGPGSDLERQAHAGSGPPGIPRHGRSASCAAARGFDHPGHRSGDGL